MKQGDQRAFLPELEVILPLSFAAWQLPAARGIHRSQTGEDSSNWSIRKVLRYNFVLGEVVVWKCRCRARSVSAVPGTVEPQGAAGTGRTQPALEHLKHRAGLADSDLELPECRQSSILSPCTQTGGQLCSPLTPVSVPGADWHTPWFPACLQVSFNATKATAGTVVDLLLLTAGRDVLPSHCLGAANPPGPFIRMDDFWLSSPKSRVVTARIHWMLLFIKQRPAQLTFPKHSWIWFRERAVKS